MKKQKVFLPLSSFLIILCIILFCLAKWRNVSLPFVNTLFAPLRKITFVAEQKIFSHAATTTDENNEELVKKLVTYAQIQQDNVAYRDQFRTTTVSPQKLLPAHIVGEPGFVPGLSAIDQVIIDKGSSDGVHQGMIVIYKDNLIGKVMQTTSHFSQVTLLGDQSISFSAETLDSDARGVVKGQGSGVNILDNVILSQTLKKGAIVMTAGDMDMQGNGYPPHLVVGKISSIEKDPSALFQQADMQQLVDVTKLEMVFIILNK